MLLNRVLPSGQSALTGATAPLRGPLPAYLALPIKHAHASPVVCLASYEDAPQRPSYGQARGGGGGGRGQGGRGRGGGRPGSNAPRYTEGGPQGKFTDRNGRQSSMSDEQRAMYREVRDAVNSCKNWRDLAGVLEAKSSIMDADNISNMLELLTWDGRPHDPEERAGFDALLSTLMGWCLALMPTFQPRQTAKVIGSLGRLQLYSEELVNNLLEKAIEHMSRFKRDDHGLMCEGLLKLGVAPDARFVAEFCSKTLPSIPDWWHETIAQVLNYFASMSAVPNPDWMEAVASAYTNRARFLQGPDFVNMLLVMGLTSKDTGWQPSQELLDRVLDSSKEFITPPPPQPPQQSREGRQQQRRPLKKKVLYVPDYTRVLWALSNFEARPSKEWYALLYSGLARQQRFWTPEDIGAVALYLGRYLQAPVTIELADRLQKYLTNPGQMGLLGADGAAAVLYVLAISGIKPNERWLDDMVIEIKEMMPQFSILGLEMVYNGLPMLGTGYRLNEVITDAANRYNALVAAEQQGAEGGGEQQQPEMAGLSDWAKRLRKDRVVPENPPPLFASSNGLLPLLGWSWS